MKLKMLEHYRDAQVYFAQGDEVDEVKAGSQLAQWLIENGKAVKVEQPEEKPVEVKDENKESQLDNRRKR